MRCLRSNSKKHWIAYKIIATPAHGAQWVFSILIEFFTTSTALTQGYADVEQRQGHLPSMSPSTNVFNHLTDRLPTGLPRSVGQNSKTTDTGFHFSRTTSSRGFLIFYHKLSIYPRACWCRATTRALAFCVSKHSRFQPPYWRTTYGTP